MDKYIDDWSKMRDRAERVESLKRENIIRLAAQTQHLTGLPATMECLHLAHNWYRCNPHKWGREPAKAFRRILFLGDRQFDSYRIVEAWSKRVRQSGMPSYSPGS